MTCVVCAGAGHLESSWCPACAFYPCRVCGLPTSSADRICSDGCIREWSGER